LQIPKTVLWSYMHWSLKLPYWHLVKFLSLEILYVVRILVLRMISTWQKGWKTYLPACPVVIYREAENCAMILQGTCSLWWSLCLQWDMCTAIQKSCKFMLRSSCIIKLSFESYENNFNKLDVK
jgi:hypothetical protein